MKKRIDSVLVIGLGMVGSLTSILLQKKCGLRVTGMDTVPHDDFPVKTAVCDVKDKENFRNILEEHDAVVSCLPYHLNREVAGAAHSLGKCYFDLTEDVPTTRAIMELAETASAVMAPQCGLAPGFISIVGADLARKFETLRSIELRVGALPQHPRGLLGYAFNWSPEGVVNEYLNDCDVIKDGKQAKVTSMEGLETIVIDGIQLEAFTTSGGLGSMCDTYAGKVEKLNYKTIRYPGHCKLMRFFFNELYMRNRRELAGEILTNAKPPVEDDVVYVHAAVEGWRNGVLGREEFVHSFFPQEIAGRMWKAIAWTTAASVCAVVEQVAKGLLLEKGLLKQEMILLDKFFKTSTGKLFLN